MNITLLDYNVLLLKRNVKRVNIKIYPDCSIRISAPKEVSIDKIEKIMKKHKKNIDNQITKFKRQERLIQREYVSGEDHYINGKRYILEVIDSSYAKIEIVNYKTIRMYVRKSSSINNKERLMNSFYKKLLEDKIQRYMPIISEEIGVEPKSYRVRKMKNKWGCCNRNNSTITFNLELAKKNDSEIKYVITHELLHLIEQKHNNNFYDLMNKYYPTWKKYHNSINRIISEKKK